MQDKATIKWTLKFQGAEAKIWFGEDSNGRPVVKKERFPKTYRHPTLDERLNKERIRAESRIIAKLKKKSPELRRLLPDVLKVDETDIIMTRILDAPTLSDYLQSSVDVDKDATLLENIGSTIGLIHKAGVTHGDITTTNLLVNNQKEIIPIDFGLSISSEKTEDRAVDLYVLERSFLTGAPFPPESFELILDAYVKVMGEKGPDVRKKLDEVRMRGRKRTMVG